MKLAETHRIWCRLSTEERYPYGISVVEMLKCQRRAALDYPEAKRVWDLWTAARVVLRLS